MEAKEDGKGYIFKWGNRDYIWDFSFLRMLKQSKFCDVTIAGQDGAVQAHKLVLAACSPYLESLFELNSESKQIISLPDVSSDILVKIVNFAYEGEIEIEEEENEIFLEVAKKLQLKGFSDKTVDKVLTPPKTPVAEVSEILEVKPAVEVNQTTPTIKTNPKAVYQVPKRQRFKPARFIDLEPETSMEPEKKQKLDKSETEQKDRRLSVLRPGETITCICGKSLKKRYLPVHLPFCRLNPDQNTRVICPKPFICPICSKGLSRRDKLMNHIQTFHGKARESM